MTDLVGRVGIDRAHGAFVIAHVDLDYHTEVRKDHGEVTIAVRLAHVGTSSLRLEHEVRLPDERVAASGTTVMVAWDPAARSKRPLSEAERAALI
jgi:acyl-CoA thioesterase FadM